jgi:hypothetical protein
VVNSIRGQWGGVAHQGGCSRAVGGRSEGNGSGGGVWSDGRWLTVREGGTQRRGARSGDGELRGGSGPALHGGLTAVEQGGIVGAMGGRKKGCSCWRGVGLPL